MQYDYWQKQVKDSPLYPNLLWSRPENRLYAGKLLIIGGHAQGFTAPAEAFRFTQKAGIGVARVVLPDALQKTIGQVLEAGEYAPSTPSGSFSKQALGELLPLAHWADGVLVAGDLGRNSETAILLESFLSKTPAPVTLTKDAIEYITAQPHMVAQRDRTLLVLSFSQLQRLATELRFATAFTSQMDIFKTVSSLHELTNMYRFSIITKHLDQLFVAVDGHISTTPCIADERLWRLRTASAASVWWLQQPEQAFAAITTSIVAGES